MRIRQPIRTGQADLDMWLLDVYQALAIHAGSLAGIWGQSNVAAGQTNVVLNLQSSLTNAFVTQPYPGDIVSITIASNAARTAGTLTVIPTINGTEVTRPTSALDATDTQFAFGQTPHSTTTFDEGDRLGVQITTTGAWAPITADIVVALYVLY